LTPIPTHRIAKTDSGVGLPENRSLESINEIKENDRDSSNSNHTIDDTFASYEQLDNEVPDTFPGRTLRRVGGKRVSRVNNEDERTAALDDNSNKEYGSERMDSDEAEGGRIMIYRELGSRSTVQIIRTDTLYSQHGETSEMEPNRQSLANKLRAKWSRIEKK